MIINMTVLTKVKILSSFLLVILLGGILCACGSPAPEVTNEEELSTYQMEIDLLGAKHEASVDSLGKLEAKINLSSADDEVSLSLNEGTILLDKDEKPLQTIHVAVDPSPPPPPEYAHIIGTVYDLTPQGATFNPPLKFTISYDPAELPQGLRESDVYIACYEDSKWGKVPYKQVDTEKHRVTTQVSHFARYSILAPRELPKPQPKPSPQPGITSISLEQALSSGKPTLAEFGSNTCMPCKQMKPILEELAIEYEDKLNVVIVEVYEHRDLASQYQIMAIPTQIFFDSSGKETTRHIGFWSKEEIITRLKEVGIE